MKIFVYGTLKSGHKNHYLIAGHCKLVGRAVVGDHAMYTHPRIGFPMMVPFTGERVFGEVYEVVRNPAHVLSILDTLEGYDEHDTTEKSLFVRSTVKTDLGDCTAYLYNQSPVWCHTVVENW